MAKHTLPTPEELRNGLLYDPDTGALVWKRRADRSNVWNARYAGKPAMQALNSNGYKSGAFNWCSLVAHRVVWAVHYGRWPARHIDHINGDRTDNRICNLRDVAHIENQLNKSMPNTNTSSVVGVSWDKSKGKWVAKATRNYKTVLFGRFDTFEDAVSAYNAAKSRHGFHKNHGRSGLAD